MNEKEKTILKYEIDALSFSKGFEEETLNLIKEKKKSYKTGKIIRISMAAAIITVIMSISAFALPKLLTAKQVAERLKMTELGALLESENAKVEQSITCDNLVLTLHSAVHGKELVKRNGLDVEEDRDYFIISIISKDDEKLNTVTNEIHFTPLVSGYKVYDVNVCTLGTSVQIIEEDGVLYYLINTDTLKPFADRTIYIAAFDGMMPFDKFISNDDGGFDYAENYEGTEAIFTLPKNYFN